jgi:hypothetical protein
MSWVCVGRLTARLSLFLPVLEIKDNPWSPVTIIGLKHLTPAILAYGLPSYFHFLLVLDIKCNCWPAITTIGSNDLLQNPCSTQINPYISIQMPASLFTAYKLRLVIPASPWFPDESVRVDHQYGLIDWEVPKPFSFPWSHLFSVDQEYWTFDRRRHLCSFPMYLTVHTGILLNVLFMLYIGQMSPGHIEGVISACVRNVHWFIHSYGKILYTNVPC